MVLNFKQHILKEIGQYWLLRMNGIILLHTLAERKTFKAAHNLT